MQPQFALQMADAINMDIIEGGKMEKAIEFNLRLRSLMEESNPRTTQQTLANAIGVKRQSIAQYLSGTVQPPLSTVVSIADYFDVSLDYLTGRTEYKSSDMSIRSICEKIGLSESAVRILGGEVDGSIFVTDSRCYKNPLADNYWKQWVQEVISALLDEGQAYLLDYIIKAIAKENAKSKENMDYLEFSEEIPQEQRRFCLSPKLKTRLFAYEQENSGDNLIKFLSNIIHVMYMARDTKEA